LLIRRFDADQQDPHIVIAILSSEFAGAMGGRYEVRFYLRYLRRGTDFMSW
jgi:hypothetical protein